MYSIPWYRIVLITVPQTILIIRIGFGLFNLQVNTRQCLLATLIMSVVTYFLRKLPLMFGIHTIALVILLTILVVILQRIDFWRSLIAVLLGVMILGVIENSYLPLLLQFASRTVTDLAEQPWFNVAAFLPEFLLALLLYAFIRQRNFVLFDLKRTGEVQKPVNHGVFIIAVILLQSFLLVLIGAALLVNQQRFNIAVIVPWMNMAILMVADSPARGYGLYLVSRLLERYQGTIEVTSRGQTSIIVRLADKGSNKAAGKSHSSFECWMTGG